MTPASARRSPPAFVSNPKYPDVVVGNKKGVFVFKHEAKEVTRAEWEKAQPKPQADTK